MNPISPEKTDINESIISEMKKALNKINTGSDPTVLQSYISGYLNAMEASGQIGYIEAADWYYDFSIALVITMKPDTSKADALQILNSHVKRSNAILKINE